MPAYISTARTLVAYRLEVFHKVLVLNSISSSDGRVSQSITGKVQAFFILHPFGRYTKYFFEK